mgnify:FL=1
MAIGQSLLILTTPLEEYRTIFANGFAYPFINLDILDETLPFLSELSVFSYGFSVDGQLIPPILPIDDLLYHAFSYQTVPILTLTPFGPDGTFSNQLIHQMLSDDFNRDTLIQQVYIEVVEKGFGGVNVDFEYILSLIHI